MAQREDTRAQVRPPAAPAGPARARLPELSPFETVNYFFDRAADHVGLEDEMRADRLRGYV